MLFGSRSSGVIRHEPSRPIDTQNSQKAFVTKLRSIDIRSREFPVTLAEMLVSQEGVDRVLSLQGEDALILVNILYQVFEAPNISLYLRTRSVHILRRVCGLQAILPSSCILSDVSKEGDISFASGGFSDLWKGHGNGGTVCVKAIRAETAENLHKIRQAMFREIVIWKRLSHQNVLSVQGVSPKLFPLCIISEWMVNGNILDFTSKHPEANRLRLLAETANGLHYLHAMDIIHGGLKPTNILIDRHSRPRLSDYGITPIISDPTIVDPGSTTSPSAGTVRYMSPELLNPSGFGIKNSNPTSKSDIYSFGVVMYQVITGIQPFWGAKDGVIIYNVVTGQRPGRPNEGISNDLWRFISDCWSSSLDERPDSQSVASILNDAVDGVAITYTRQPGETLPRPDNPTPECRMTPVTHQQTEAKTRSRGGVKPKPLFPRIKKIWEKFHQS